ncbi:hypothetical protein [Flagellimonas baculiformis]|uniref:hypothetical protein n=1 Tax=Flagellimonas baculiformis TaxID=3067310 RepID=UPI00296FC4E8|nr:hypothetical protein [Muricauda sp. D6]
MKFSKPNIKTLLFIIPLIMLTACSDDGGVSPDAIVGEWLTVGRETKSGIAGELSFCEERIFNEYTSEGIRIAKWTTGDAPTECADLNLSTLMWENVGNNRWEVGTGTIIVSIIRLEGNRLIEENQDNEWIYFYERR